MHKKSASTKPAKQKHKKTSRGKMSKQDSLLSLKKTTWMQTNDVLACEKIVTAHKMCYPSRQ